MANKYTVYRHIALCVLAAVCCGMAAARQTADSKPDAALQRELTIIDSVYAYDLNPHTANYAAEAQILGNLYEGLFSYDPVTLEPVPALAQSYTVSRSRLRWIFTIREGAAFSSGEPITAESVRDSWLSLLAPDAHTPFASLLDCVSGAREYRSGTGSRDDVGITARADNTLAVVLTEPTEHLPQILCHHAFSVVSPEQGVYSGAYVLVERNEHDIRLKKNEYYWDAANTAIPAVHITQSDDLSENTFRFNTGAVQWVIGAANAQEILDREAVQLAAQFATEYLFFKANRFPWDRSDFRNALLAAVPWDVLRGSALVPAQTFIYPLTGYPAGPGFTQYDLEDARMQLAAAKKAAGLEPDCRLELVFAIPDGEYMQQQAEILRQAWEALGIAVSVVKTPSSRYFESVSAGWQADVFSYTWIGDYADPMAFLELFRGHSTLNESAWENSEYDSLLEQAAAASSSQTRLELLSQAEQLLLDEAMVIPVSHPVSLNFVSLSELGGWYTNALDIHPFKYLYFKKTNIELPNLVYARQ